MPARKGWFIPAPAPCAITRQVRLPAGIDRRPETRCCWSMATVSFSTVEPGSSLLDFGEFAIRRYDLDGKRLAIARGAETVGPALAGLGLNLGEAIFGNDGLGTLAGDTSGGRRRGNRRGGADESGGSRCSLLRSYRPRHLRPRPPIATHVVARSRPIIALPRWRIVHRLRREHAAPEHRAAAARTKPVALLCRRVRRSSAGDDRKTGDHRQTPYDFH